MTGIKHLKYNYVVMALIISSFAKGSVLLLLIWQDYSQHNSFALVIALFVLSSHVVALRVFLNNNTIMAIWWNCCEIFISRHFEVRINPSASFSHLIYHFKVDNVSFYALIFDA